MVLGYKMKLYQLQERMKTMSENVMKYPVFKNQDSLWTIVQNRKQKFIDICIEKGLPEEIAEYIIKRDFDRYQESGLIGCYYLLYNAFINSDISDEDVEGKAENSLQYILGFCPEIDDYVMKFCYIYNAFSNEEGKDYIKNVFFSRLVHFSDLYITVVQTKYALLNEEIEKFIYKAENICDLVIYGEDDYILSLPEEKKEEEIRNRIKWKFSYFGGCNIKGNNLIGKNKVEYEAGGFVKDCISKWEETHNKLKEGLADCLKDHIKFAFEVYLENGDASGPNGTLVEYPVLSIYVSKKLILSRNMESIESYMEFIKSIKSISMASKLMDFEYEAAYDDDDDDDETVKRLIDKISDNELYNELMKLPSNVISELYDDCNNDVQSIHKRLPIYEVKYDVMTSLNVSLYDLVYSTYDQDEDYELYDVIDFILIDKHLDDYIEDAKNGILYDSYDCDKDINYFMYILLNILDKRVNTRTVKRIYESQTEDILYTYGGVASKGLTFMRLRAEGISIREDK